MRAKCFIIAISALLAVVTIAEEAVAQQRVIQKFEFELSAGIMFPSVNPYPYNTIGYPGGQLSIELRHNINTKFDIGVQLSASRFVRYDVSQFNRGNMRVKTLIPSILFDYNQRLSNNFSILVGAGIGFMFPLGGDEAFLEGSSASEMLNIYPRIGIELYDRLRFTAEYRIALIESGYAAITLGYVFGGRPK